MPAPIHHRLSTVVDTLHAHVLASRRALAEPGLGVGASPDERGLR